MKREEAKKIKNEGLPISENICDSISDFYSIMHLIHNVWTYKEYKLRDFGCGYDVLDKDGEVRAWIGIRENSKAVELMLEDITVVLKRFQKNLDGKEVEHNFDEDWNIWSQLMLRKILKEKTENTQRQVLKTWIKEAMRVLTVDCDWIIKPDN